MNLDVVSLMKSKLHMKLIIWGISPEAISIQVDFQDFRTTNSINSRDSGKITLVTNSTKTRVVHLQGHNSKGLVSMIEQ